MATIQSAGGIAKLAVLPGHAGTLQAVGSKLKVISEHAILSIQPGREDEFEAAIAKAPALFAQVDGCHGIELRRCIENPSTYQIILGWDDVEAHTERFRGSPQFSEWRSLVGEFFASPPTVQHYRVV